MASKKASPPPELTKEQVAAGQLLAEKETVISALTATASRHAETAASLKVQVSALSQQLAASKADLYDINEFLLNELKAQALIGASLEDQVAASLLELQAAKAAALEAAADQARRREAEIASLQRQLSSLQANSAEASAFLREKAGLQQQLRDLAQAKDAERAAANKRISQLERLANEDLVRAQKESVARVAEARQQARQEVAGQVLEQNDSLQRSLSEQSQQLERLVARNGELTRENATLRREASVSAGIQEALAQRCHAFQTTLRDQMQEQQVIRQERESLAEAWESAQNRKTELEATVAQSRSQDRQRDEEMRGLRAQVAAHEDRISVLEELCDEAARAIKDSLSERPSPILQDLLRQLQAALDGTAWAAAVEATITEEEGVRLPPIGDLRTRVTLVR